MIAIFRRFSRNGLGEPRTPSVVVAEFDELELRQRADNGWTIVLRRFSGGDTYTVGTAKLRYRGELDDVRQVIADDAGEPIDLRRWQSTPYGWTDL